jgi:peroxiredoxin
MVDLVAKKDGPVCDMNEKIDLGSVLGQHKKCVLFAVPGAFTPTCSAQHLPGFIAKANDLKSKGVEAIYCLSVNDRFVMRAW